MLRIRHFEEKIVNAYPEQEMKTPVHLCIGQEAVAAGICAHLRSEDYLATTHRNHGHCLAKGVSPRAMFAEFYGRVTGCCRGKGGSMHLCSPENGVLGTSAIVGGGIPIATGYGMAIHLRGESRMSVGFFGDGASEEGSFHESLNFACLHKLPVLFVCENNSYATNSPIGARQLHPDIFRRASAYGLPAELVDGNDAVEVYRAGRRAVEYVRSGQGPYFLECRTYRFKGHVGPECDWEKGCRPKDELLAWMERCPVATLTNTLLREGEIDQAWLDALAAKDNAEFDEAISFGRSSPFPDPAELTMHVYAEPGQGK